MNAKRKIVALIPAAGSGKRMRSTTHKAFLSYQGRTILEYTLERFQNSKTTDAIIVLLHPHDMPKEKKLMLQFPKIAACLAGGKERKDSVLTGTTHISQAFPGSIVMIHDAARPFVTDALIKKLIAAVKPGQGAIPGIKEPNTLKKVNKGIIKNTVDRRDVWEVQTPQCFIIEDIHKALEKQIHKKITDDSQAMELCGKKMVMVESTSFNFKITYPEDLKLFKLRMEKGS